MLTFLFQVQCQKLNIAVSTAKRRFNHATYSEFEFGRGTVNLVNYPSVFLRIANNAAAAYFAAAHLELRLMSV